MKTLTKEEIEARLRKAVLADVPDRAEDLWDRPAGRACGGEWYLDKSAGKTTSFARTARLLTAAAAVVLLFLVSSRLYFGGLAATIYLDVNPSLSLKIDREEKVIDASAVNSDGEAILAGMDLKGTDLDVALNALLGSMVRHGYLSEARHMILLTVDSRDAGRAEELRGRLSSEIDETLTALIGSGSVLGQTIGEDEELEVIARTYGLSVGKAALLKKIVQAVPSLTYEELAPLSMSELARYLRDRGLDLRAYAEYVGSGSLEEDDFDDLYDSDDDETGGGTFAGAPAMREDRKEEAGDADDASDRDDGPSSFDDDNDDDGDDGDDDSDEPDDDDDADDD